MFGIKTHLVAIIMTFGLAVAPLAQADSDQQNLVERARITVDDLRKDQEFGNARELIKSAKGIMIVPSLVRGGFFIGGEGGEGVLLTRSGVNDWSHPAFYTLASASFGLQIGLEESELVLFVMSDRALNDFMSDEFKIGAQAGLAIVTLGSTAEASTTTNLHADIIIWSSNTGAYAGLTLNGSLIKPRDTWNEAYYGRPESVRDIVAKRSVQNPGAAGLRQELAAISG
ncbi:MAG: lipid-binding SYLF domain-containing protein [Aliidongia sp.]